MLITKKSVFNAPYLLLIVLSWICIIDAKRAHGQSAGLWKTGRKSATFPVNKGTTSDDSGSPTNPTLSPENNIIQFNSGVMLLNPYAIKTNGSGQTVLSDGDSQARFFIELAANYIWAWNYDRRARWANKYGGDADGGKWQFLGAPDFSGRITYIANTSDESSAASIVGTGEFGMETTVGLPLYRAIYTVDRSLKASSALGLYDKTSHAHWLGVVGSWSGTTDGKGFDIHSRGFLGVGYRAAFAAPWESESEERHREVALSFQTGPSLVDSVRFVDENSSRVIETVGVEDPKYSSTFSWAFEAEAYVPISKTLNGVMGVRLYTLMDDAPNLWNAYIGVTIPLNKLAKLLE